jgi:hypothetical protein
MEYSCCIVIHFESSTKRKADRKTGNECSQEPPELLVGHDETSFQSTNIIAHQRTHHNVFTILISHDAIMQSPATWIALARKPT